MSVALRVLVLEDNVLDAELAIRELRRAGFEPQWQRVETEAEFLAALAVPPELILADYSLPSFDGLAALALVRERALDAPFILVSGSLGEEAAVAAIKQGATDFLLKDRMTRLGPAVERALEEYRLRRERAEQDLKIARLSRIRAVIGGISSAILRVRDRAQLFSEACRVASQDGVFPLAWVTDVHPDTQALQIVALHGADAQSFAPIQEALLAVPEIERPGYQVARSGQRMIVNDVTLPRQAVLGGRLQQAGYLSGAILPLFVGGQVVAILSLLARERNFFDEEEIALLDWMTADLSFALEAIDKSAQLEHLAYFDALTGLCNARLFQDRLNQFVHAARQDHSKVCVVVADLIGFTLINDTLGRAVGDEILRQVGARFGEFLTEPFALGRIGADTFAAASPRGGQSIATQLGDELREALQQPLLVNGQEVSISAQFGIAFFPADGADCNDVFKNAEAALKIAKSSGERCAYYSGELHERMALRRTFENELHEAVLRQEFVLHYQPRIDMLNGELIGAEALIRWQHPQRGLIAPAEFIEVAEATGLIVTIGAWVIDSVCAQQATWSDLGLAIVSIAVNLSSVQFEQGEVLPTVRAALSRNRLAAEKLTLELTETAVMKDPVAAAATLQALRKLGVGLSLDDFGTGYSSLAHLRRFPFDSVKIDRSFVTDITRNPEDAAICTAIIAMAHKLRLKVVAEGVETQGQFNYLRAHKCDEMQGFLFGPAVPAGQFEMQLRSGLRLPMPVLPPGDQRTLLLVDDESGIRAALSRVLRREGYRILTAASGHEGLELLALNRVQVIISDQRMPGLSGTEFLNTVRQLYPQTVRIILSGYTDLAVLTDAVNRGAVFKFITKPWDDELLREQVREAFRGLRSDSNPRD